MLHNGHDLNGVVAQGLDPGQDLLPEFVIGANPGLLLGHAHMALVNVGGLFPAEARVGPPEGLLGSVNLGVPLDGLGILHHIVGVEGNAVQLPAVVHHDGHDLLAVLQGVRSGEFQLPDAVFLLVHGIGMALPAVEIAGEIHGLRCRRPLPVDPAAPDSVNAEILIAVGKIAEALAVFQQLLLFVLIIRHPLIQIPGILLQQGINPVNFQVSHRFLQSEIQLLQIFVFLLIVSRRRFSVNHFPGKGIDTFPLTAAKIGGIIH